MKFFPIRHSLKALHRDSYYDISATPDDGPTHCLLTNKDKNYVDIDIRDYTIISNKLRDEMDRYRIYINCKETKEALMSGFGIGIFKNRISIVYVDKFGVYYKINKMHNKYFIRFVVVCPSKFIKLYKYKKEKR